MTTFKAALGVCGLSQQEAADFLSVSLPTIKDWSRGKSAPPIGVWGQLSRLLERIEDAADSASGMIEPGLIDRRAANNLQADLADDPLPGGAADAAGALALLMAIRDTQDDLP